MKLSTLTAAIWNNDETYALTLESFFTVGCRYVVVVPAVCGTTKSLFKCLLSMLILSLSVLSHILEILKFTFLWDCKASAPY